MTKREDGPLSAPANWLARIFAYASAIILHLMFAGLAIIGPLIVHAMYRDWRAGEIETVMALLFGLFGLLMMTLGLGFFWFGYVGAPRLLGNLNRTREKYRDRPWLANRSWRARRVVHSTRYTAWFMWFWCFAWWGILGLLWSVNRELILADLQSSWDVALPTALPALAGLIGVLIAMNLTWQRWRYGDAALLIDSLPGYLGEQFSGRVLAGLSQKPAKPVTLRLVCGSMRQEERRDSKGRTATVYVTDELWSSEKELAPAQMSFNRGRLTIPIDLDLPRDLPESGHILDEPQIVWKLAIVPAAGRSQPLRCDFPIPVFARCGRTSSH